MSPMLVMPSTTVVKTIGAMSMRISLDERIAEGLEALAQMRREVSDQYAADHANGDVDPELSVPAARPRDSGRRRDR